MSKILYRELVFRLIETSRLLNKHVDQRAREHGTSRAQWTVLGRLRRQQGQTQVDLAEHLELQPISLVRLLDRLVEQGFVERREDPRDRRVNRLYLTEAGLHLVESLEPLAHEIRGELLDGLDTEAIQTSLNLLDEIKGRLKALEAKRHETAEPLPRHAQSARRH